MKPQLVLFDCDGVLVDSEPLAARVLSEILREFGMTLSPQEVDLRFRGRSLHDILLLIEDEQGKKLPSTFLPRLQEATQQAFDQDLRAVPGVRELLQVVQDSGCKLCVGSSGTHEKIRHSLQLTGLSAYFGEHIFSAQDVPRGKPAPDLFLHAARSMGAAPEQTWVIEDSVPGAQAGRAAGMRVFGYAASGNAQELAETGAVVFSSMSEWARELRARWLPSQS